MNRFKSKTPSVKPLENIIQSNIQKWEKEDTNTDQTTHGHPTKLTSRVSIREAAKTPSKKSDRAAEIHTKSGVICRLQFTKVFFTQRLTLPFVVCLKGPLNATLCEFHRALETCHTERP